VECEYLYMCLPFRLGSHPSRSSTSPPIKTTGTPTSTDPAYPAYSNARPGPNRLAQARRAARSSEEESDGEDGAFALGM
jgi:hypothetical protein